MRGVHLKRKLKYTEKLKLHIAGCYIVIDSYMRKYYNECYNRDIQVHNLEN